MSIEKSKNENSENKFLDEINETTIIEFLSRWIIRIKGKIYDCKKVLFDQKENTRVMIFKVEGNELLFPYYESTRTFGNLFISDGIISDTPNFIFHPAEYPRREWFFGKSLRNKDNNDQTKYKE